MAHLGRRWRFVGLVPKDKKDQNPKFKTAFYQHSAPARQNSALYAAVCNGTRHLTFLAQE